MPTRKQFCRALRNMADLLESPHLNDRGEGYHDPDFQKLQYQLKKLGQELKIIQEGLDQLAPTRVKWSKVFKME